MYCICQKLCLHESEKYSLWIFVFRMSFTNTTATEGHSTATLAKTFEGWETDRLIKFLRDDKKFKDLGLDDSFFTRLDKEKITGHLFLKLTRQEFREFGMEISPALELE